jgi:uncharacterized protein
VQFRSLPKHPDVRLSILGFGCMRLPILDRDMSRVDEPLAEALARKAIDAGVNFFDTAYPYHNGNSERFVGRLLKGGLRNRVFLQTKLPVWLVKEEADWERLLEEQLTRLQTDHVDSYLLHALSSDRWETVTKLGGLKAMERARADGRIKHIGFSFHGSPDSFTEIVNAFDWDLCQIQYNFMDEAFQAGTIGLQQAAARRIGVIAMEPLRGGLLAADGPAEVQEMWRNAPPAAPADRALRWVWNHPEVVSALSGMNADRQLDENLASVGRAAAGGMSDAEAEAIAGVRDIYQRRMKVECTTCGYCVPCPSGVAIPDVFSAYNTSTMFDAKSSASMVYRFWVMSGGHGADACIHCGDCEPKCPQHIQIADRLEEAHRHLVG